jgi:NADPH:quinone reductase-like Zn-dependent oxidoreductase
MDPGAAGTLSSAGISLLKQAGENSVLVMVAGPDAAQHWI